MQIVITKNGVNKIARINGLGIRSFDDTLKIGITSAIRLNSIEIFFPASNKGRECNILCAGKIKSNDSIKIKNPSVSNFMDECTRLSGT